MNMQLIHKLLELDAEKHRLQKQLDELQKEYQDINAQVIDEFVQAGVSSLNLAGKTLYLHEQTWAHVVGDNAIEQLRANGLDDCLMVSTQRLSALARELGEDGFYKEYPELKDVVEFTPKTTVRVRSA